MKQKTTLTVRVPEELKDRIRNKLRQLRTTADKKQKFVKIGDLLDIVPSRPIETMHSIEALKITIKRGRR
ncbi:MAG: hypothetical protein WCY01_10980 [Alkalispirochaeta sp.]